MRRRLAALALCAAVIVAAACGGDAVTAPLPPPPLHPAPGAAGAGDPYYPDDGNGGYDALNYHVDATYDPPSGHLDGDTTVTAKATQDLSRFDCDLRGLDVQSVEVDGQPAHFTREKAFELVVTPAAPIRAGTPVSPRARLGGDPAKPPNDGGSENGWQHSPDGGAYMVGEPHSAAF